MPSIVVAGATGMLGKPVVRELIAAGFQVTALVRTPEAARRQLPDSVQLIQSNLSDTQALATQLQGHDFLYISLGVAPESRVQAFQPEREGIRNLLVAAHQARIRRVGYLSSLLMNYDGFDWWVFQLKREAARAVAESPVPSVIFRPTAFMETLRDRQIRGNKVLGAGTSQARNYWIAGSDYGKQVVQAFQTIPDGESRDYVIQGPEAMTQREAVELFARQYGKGPLQVQWAPLGMLKVIGVFARPVGYAAKIIEALNHQPETFQAEAAWRDLGKPTTTLAEFAANSK